MFAIVLALVFSKLPIGWKQVFKHFTGVLELCVCVWGINENLCRANMLILLMFSSYGTKDVKLPETCMYSLMHQ